MVDGPEVIGPRPASPRRREVAWIALAGALAIIGAIAGAYYFAMRPVVLRIAMAPRKVAKNPGMP